MDTTLIENSNDSTQITNKKGITGSTLKIIAIIAMFIDHFAAILINGFVENSYPANINSMSYDEIITWSYSHPLTGYMVNLETILRCIGRFGFPLFVFLLIEGFTHTHSVKKYLRNLFIFAIISEIPFNLGFNNLLFYPNYQNVFFTLFLGVLALCGIKYLGEERQYSTRLVPLSYLVACISGFYLGYLIYASVIGQLSPINLFDRNYILISIVIATITTLVYFFISRDWNFNAKNRFTFTALPIIIVSLFGDILHTDYGTFGILTIVIMYLLRNNKQKAFSYGVLALVFLSPEECFAYLMLPLVKRYNGKRGINLKYFFYAFYPCHILIIWLATYLLGYATFAIH